MPHSNLCKFYINRLPLVYSTVWAIVRKNATAKLPFCSISNVRTLLECFFLLRQLAPMMSYTCTLYSIVHGFSWHCPFILQLQVLVTLSLYTAATGTRNTVPLYYSYGFSWHCPFTSATGSCATFDLYCSYGFSWHCPFILQLRVLVWYCPFILQLRVLVTLSLYTTAAGSRDTVPLYCSYGFL